MELIINKAYKCIDGSELVIRSSMGGVKGAQYCICDLYIHDSNHFINKPITASPRDLKALLGLKDRKITITK